MAILINLLAVKASPTDAGDWQWDKTKVIAQVPLTFINKSCKFLTQWLVENKYLSEASLSKVTIDDDGAKMTVLVRETKMPLFSFDLKNTVITARSKYRTKVTPILSPREFVKLNNPKPINKKPLRPDAFVKSKQVVRV